MDAWLTDFRDDVSRIDVPTLIIHGDADRNLPFPSTAARMEKAVKGCRLVVIKDGPHAIGWTHADEVNRALTEFLELQPPMGRVERRPVEEAYAPHSLEPRATRAVRLVFERRV
ncbi:MAG: alpha/beta hydrolase [Myxococcaceae bacterium]